MKNQLRLLIACCAIAACNQLHAITFQFHSLASGWPPSFLEISPGALASGTGTAADIMDFSLSSYLGFTLQKGDPSVSWSLASDFSVSADRSYLMGLNLTATGPGGQPLFRTFYEPSPPPWAGGHELDGPWRHAAYSTDGAQGGFTSGTWDRVPEAGSSLCLLVLGLLPLAYLGRKHSFLAA